MSQPNPVDPTDLVRGLWSGSNELRERAQRQVDTMLAAQQKLLSEFEHIALSWFDRRHSSSEEAARAAQAIAGSTDVAEAMRAYQQWLAGNVSRLVTETLEVQAHGARILRALAGAVQAAGREPSDETPTPTGETTPAEATAHDSIDQGRRAA
jgi:hypothetical protein